MDIAVRDWWDNGCWSGWRPPRASSNPKERSCDRWAFRIQTSMRFGVVGLFVFVLQQSTVFALYHRATTPNNSNQAEGAFTYWPRGFPPGLPQHIYTETSSKLTYRADALEQAYNIFTYFKYHTHTSKTNVHRRIHHTEEEQAPPGFTCNKERRK